VTLVGVGPDRYDVLRGDVVVAHDLDPVAACRAVTATGSPA
jgi:hypothetical protein